MRETNDILNGAEHITSLPPRGKVSPPIEAVTDEGITFSVYQLLKERLT